VVDLPSLHWSANFVAAGPQGQIFRFQQLASPYRHHVLVKAVNAGLNRFAAHRLQSLPVASFLDPPHQFGHRNLLLGQVVSVQDGLDRGLARVRKASDTLGGTRSPGEEMNDFSVELLEQPVDRRSVHIEYERGLLGREAPRPAAGFKPLDAPEQPGGLAHMSPVLF